MSTSPQVGVLISGSFFIVGRLRSCLDWHSYLDPLVFRRKKMLDLPPSWRDYVILVSRVDLFYTPVQSDLSFIRRFSLCIILLWEVISVVLVLLGLGGVAFTTLLERKLLGLRQIRLGPNKVTMNGLLQPVIDGVKLLFKQLHVVSPSQPPLFILSPALLLILFVVIWSWVIPWGGAVLFLKYSGLLFFSLLGVRAYMAILTGWRRSSSFAKLGRLRGILQRLSFEVALILIFMVVIAYFNSFSFSRAKPLEVEIIVIWLLLWLVLSLIETNRAPFDLWEGESELIRGFNIEMRRLTFVFLFLREYGMIIVLRLIIRLVLVAAPSIWCMLYVSLILFLRSCYPRVRYDVMIRVMWEMVLPLGVILYFTTSVVK